MTTTYAQQAAASATRALSVPVAQVVDHDLAAERAVLAAVLLDDTGDLWTWGRVSAIVDRAAFYSPQHAVVFDAMAALVARGVPVDVVTLAAELRAMDRLNTVGGAQFLGALTDEIPTLSHCESHARIVAEYAARRRTYQLARAFAAKVHGGTPLGALIAGMVSALDAVPIPGVEAPTMEADVDRYAATIAGEVAPSAPPVPTGIADLDAALCGGLRHGAYYLGGLPGDGKTTLMLQIAASIAAAVGWVLVISKEQDRAAVRDILLAHLARLPLAKVVLARENPHAAPLSPAELDRLYHAINVLRGMRLRVLDLSTAGCPRTIFDVVAVARAMRPGPVAVFIDNLGEMEARGQHGSRTDLATEEKAKDLRRAKDLLKIPFVTLVHPTQDAVRGKGRLGISDIAGGGAIGRLCDGTIFLHDESRRPTRDHKKDPPTPGIVEIYTAKLRGPVGAAFCEVQRVTHEHRFASTRRRDQGGQLIDDDGVFDPSPSDAAVPDAFDEGEGLPMDGAPVFHGETGALALAPGDDGTAGAPW